MSAELMSQIFTDFGKEIGTEITVDEDAYCCLGIDDNSLIHFKFNEYFDGLIFYTEIGEMPQTGTKEIFRHYALMNGSKESETFSFSYNKEEKVIGISYILPSSVMNLDNFKITLKSFIEKFQSEMENIARYTQGSLPEDKISYGSQLQAENSTNTANYNQNFISA